MFLQLRCVRLVCQARYVAGFVITCMKESYLSEIRLIFSVMMIVRLYRRRGSFLLRDQKEPKVLINPAGAFAAQGLPTLKNRERLFLLVYAY